MQVSRMTLLVVGLVALLSLPFYWWWFWRG